MKGNWEWYSTNEQGENTFLFSSSQLLADCISKKLSVTSRLHQLSAPFINSAHVREQNFFLKASRKITPIVFLYYFRNCILVPDALCLPETSWDSTSKKPRQARALPWATPAGKSVTGKLTQLSPNKCGSNMKPYYLDTVLHVCFVGYVFLHCKPICTSFWQASQASGAHVVSWGKKSNVYHRRQANPLTQRQAFPSTESNAEQGFQTNAYPVLKVLYVLPEFP